MPFIKIEAGKVNKDQKEKLISGFTKLASETLGIAESAFTVLIKENEVDNWGVGGKMLSDILASRGN
ncbi:MAG: 4-oxalocrotonate tautomerase DmpI [Thermacetogeniaceae bacterium]